MFRIHKKTFLTSAVRHNSDINLKLFSLKTFIAIQIKGYCKVCFQTNKKVYVCGFLYFSE